MVFQTDLTSLFLLTLNHCHSHQFSVCKLKQGVSLICKELESITQVGSSVWFKELWQRGKERKTNEVKKFQRVSLHRV